MSIFIFYSACLYLCLSLSSTLVLFSPWARLSVTAHVGWIKCFWSDLNEWNLKVVRHVGEMHRITTLMHYPTEYTYAVLFTDLSLLAYSRIHPSNLECIHMATVSIPPTYSVFKSYSQTWVFWHVGELYGITAFTVWGTKQLHIDDDWTRDELLFILGCFEDNGILHKKRWWSTEIFCEGEVLWLSKLVWWQGISQARCIWLKWFMTLTVKCKKNLTVYPNKPPEIINKSTSKQWIQPFLYYNLSLPPPPPKVWKGVRNCLPVLFLCY